MNLVSVFFVGAIGAVVGAIASCFTIGAIARVIVRGMLKREGGDHA